MDPISTALSGLNAASARIGVSASNIANSQSTTTVGQNGQTVNKPYVPQEVVQKTQNGGGVSTSLRDVSPPSVPVFAPDNPAAGQDGIVQLPNVDQTREVANQILATNAYKANLNVMKRTDEMTESLLNIQS